METDQYYVERCLDGHPDDFRHLVRRQQLCWELLQMYGRNVRSLLHDGIIRRAMPYRNYRAIHDELRKQKAIQLRWHMVEWLFMPKYRRRNDEYGVFACGLLWMIERVANLAILSPVDSQIDISSVIDYSSLVLGMYEEGCCGHHVSARALASLGLWVVAFIT